MYGVALDSGGRLFFFAGRVRKRLREVEGSGCGYLSMMMMRRRRTSMLKRATERSS